MEERAGQKFTLNPDSDVVVALDTPGAAPKREFFFLKGSSLLNGHGRESVPIRPRDIASLDLKGRSGKILVVVYPTKTYSEGFGGETVSELAPEDRRMIRTLKRRYRDRVECYKVSTGGPSTDAAGKPDKRGFVEFDLKYLFNIKKIFLSSCTRPNRQDYIYLATKTFGLNLAIRLAFAVKGVLGGQLPVLRAVISTSWYQFQDIVFTIFGQTYMKFLGKMTGLLRIYNAYLGDFLLVYFQFCFLEFLNRLLLGPLGENPLVYTWRGIGLIFLNLLQGMVSGGLLVPAINKVRRAGVISHSMMMHLYQFSSLTLQFGLFASFGYQTVYALLTGSVLVLSWSSYVIFSTCFKDPEFGMIQDAGVLKRLHDLAAARK